MPISNHCSLGDDAQVETRMKATALAAKHGAFLTGL